MNSYMLFDLDRDLFEKACAEETTLAEIDHWLFHLCGVLVLAGYDARVVRSDIYDPRVDDFMSSGRVFLVEEIVEHQMINEAGRLDAMELFYSLETLGITIQYYPDFCLKAPGRPGDREPPGVDMTWEFEH